MEGRGLVFLGDIHLHKNAKTLMHKIKMLGIVDTDIFQVGDFGLGFQKLSADRLMLSALNIFLKEKNCTITIIRGNHDDPKLFKEDFGFSNINIVSDNSIVELCGKKILCVGGATSVDRFCRVEGEDYWKDEKFVFNKEVIDKLDLSGVDIICTHTAPKFAYPQTFNAFVYDKADTDAGLLRDLEIEREDVTLFYDYVKGKMPNLKHYFYGHFHKNVSQEFDGVLFRLLGEYEFYEFRC